MRAPLPDVRDRRDWEPIDEVLDVQVNAILVLQAGLDGALCVVEPTASLHPKLRHDRLSHVPDRGRQSVAPNKEAAWLQHAYDLLEDSELLGANGRLGDVCLRDEDDVDGGVREGAFAAAAAPHASGHPLTLEPRVVLGEQLVASVDRRMLHVEGCVVAARKQLGDVVRSRTCAATDLHDLWVGVRSQVLLHLLKLDQTLVGGFAVPLRFCLVLDPINVRDAPGIEGELVVRA
mmetsp:Transcript_135313/g.342376  ORF Transcript_135313/g.342376 Transcript_135313/m.342376 type:complete len:233 (+) Transcript_135313:256-954(+)